MSLAFSSDTASETELSALLLAAGAAADALVSGATANLAALVVVEGRISAAALEKEQRAAHGLAWLATYAAGLTQLGHYAERLSGEGRFGEVESLTVGIVGAEYAAQIIGGIPMNQGEMVRPADLGLTEIDLAAFRTAEVDSLIATGNTAETRARLVALMREQDGAATVGDAGLDETMEAIRSEMRRFADAEVVPHAHEWHLANDYIPMEIVEHMAGLGVFGLTIPEAFGGLGLGKESMCVVSEELSRA